MNENQYDQPRDGKNLCDEVLLPQHQRLLTDSAIAGRRLEVRVLATGLAELAEYLTRHDRLILTAPGQDPMVLLRLGDWLRNYSLKGLQQERPKAPPQVSVAVDATEAGIDGNPRTAKPQGQSWRSSAAKRGAQ